MRFVAVLLLLLAVPAHALAKAPRSGVFDYFALVLSWSPTYCADHRQDEQQCGLGRNFAFVVHGLWPQHEAGWPEYCETGESWVAQKAIDGMLDIMPSKKLVIHEWKKHGSCAGVSQADYFRAIRILYDKVRIPARYLSPTADVVTTPDQLVTDFVKTNAGLTRDMVSVSCGNARDQARLTDLRICLNRRGSFSACGKNESRQCQARTLHMPRAR